MKRKLIVGILMATLLAGCGNNAATTNTEGTPAASSEPTIPPPPTATPIPTPVPIPEVMLNAPASWMELNRVDSAWVDNEWMSDSKETLEWTTEQGVTIITTEFDKVSADKSDDIYLLYEDAIKCQVYAPHGDCEIYMVAYENTVGLLISSKWDTVSYGCFATGNVSSGIVMQALYDALGSWDKFNLYNYDMGKLLNHRISIEGEPRSIDSSYKKRLEDTAKEATGWRENGDWLASVEEIYRMLSSQKSDFEAVDATASETVFASRSKIKVCDVHLPSGYERLELFDEGAREENKCGVRLYGKNNMFTIEGNTDPDILKYIDSYIWNDEPEPEPTEEEGDKPKEGEDQPEEPKAPENTMEIFNQFSIPEGTCYLLELNSTGDDGKKTQDYMAVVINTVNETSCSMYIPSTVLDTKKKVSDLCEKVFR